MNIIFCGLPKSGKTTQGKRLATKLNWNFIDTDQAMEDAYIVKTQTRYSCRQIYMQEGETQFRELEKQQIASLQGLNKHVIAIGGGTLLDPENTKILQSLGILIYLKVPINILWERICNQGIPAYLDPSDPENAFYVLAKKRIPLYEQAAHLIIEVHGKQLFWKHF